jgi:hypothetical protein
MAEKEKKSTGFDDLDMSGYVSSSAPTTDTKKVKGIKSLDELGLNMGEYPSAGQASEEAPKVEKFPKGKAYTRATRALSAGAGLPADLMTLLGLVPEFGERAIRGGVKIGADLFKDLYEGQDPSAHVPEALPEANFTKPITEATRSLSEQPGFPSTTNLRGNLFRVGEPQTGGERALQTGLDFATLGPLAETGLTARTVSPMARVKGAFAPPPIRTTRFASPTANRAVEVGKDLARMGARRVGDVGIGTASEIGRQSWGNFTNPDAEDTGEFNVGSILGLGLGAGGRNLVSRGAPYVSSVFAERPTAESFRKAIPTMDTQVTGALDRAAADQTGVKMTTAQRMESPLLLANENRLRLEDPVAFERMKKMREENAQVLPTLTESISGKPEEAVASARAQAQSLKPTTDVGMSVETGAKEVSAKLRDQERLAHETQNKNWEPLNTPQARSWKTENTKESPLQQAHASAVDFMKNQLKWGVGDIPPEFKTAAIKKGEIDFLTLRSLDKEVTAKLRDPRQSAEAKKAYGMLKNGIDEMYDQSFAGAGADIRANIDRAKAGFKDYASTYLPDYRPGFKTPVADVLGSNAPAESLQKLIRSQETGALPAEKMLSAFGGSVKELEDATAALISREATANGTAAFDPKLARKWINTHSSYLDKFPDLKTHLDDVVTNMEHSTGYQYNANQAHEALRGQRGVGIAGMQMDAAGKLIKGEPANHARDILNTADVAGVEAANEAFKVLGSSKEAAMGYKRSIADNIMQKIDAGDFEGARAYMNHPLTMKFFPPGEQKNINAVIDSLEKAGAKSEMRATDISGEQGTGMKQKIFHGIAAFTRNGPMAYHITNMTGTARNISRAQHNVYREAMLDPKVMNALLQRNPKEANQMLKAIPQMANKITYTPPTTKEDK